MNRQAFEAWYQLEVSGCNGEWIAKDEAGQYLEPDTTNAWRAWQEATDAALETIRSSFRQDRQRQGANLGLLGRGALRPPASEALAHSQITP